MAEDTSTPSNNDFTTLDTPAIKANNDIKERHCIAFNLKAFGVDTTKPISGDNCYISKPKSLQLNDADWANHIDTLRNWTQDDKEKQLAFRRENHDGYHIVRNFEAVAITKPSGASAWQLCKVKKKKKAGGSIVIPMSGVSLIFIARSRSRLIVKSIEDGSHFCC